MHIHYNLSDNKKPVLLLIHGFLGSMQQWEHIEHQLLVHYSILKIDLPGHGSSHESKTPFTAADFIEALNFILKQEHIDRLTILGHSMGGYLGAAFAKANPKKIISLIMLNSIAGKDPKEKRLLRDRAIQLIQKHKEAYVSMAVNNLFTKVELEEFKERIHKMKMKAQTISIESIVHSLLYMRDRESSLQELKNLDIRVIYIFSLQDDIIEPALIKTECDYLNIQGKTIDCGHMSLLTNPANILEKMYFIE
ncbi:pimeloyl-ACP methyl ester carboxylesterase [Nonlabens dokdonensis]|nr:pimeloyl-ACP methyl ester carboxylesterase [Nonlabens dokdonensis]